MPRSALATLLVVAVIISIVGQPLFVTGVSAQRAGPTAPPAAEQPTPDAGVPTQSAQPPAGDG
ncbi:MAG: hypothetical protein M3462_03510, partial [Chloroflexota bacterium]|nr:hypothetical protein [Chloroflexota bacterium]